MEELSNKIIEQLPFGDKFTFVDEITEASLDEFEGVYTFREDEIFYPYHFKEMPVTPGVIIIETMGQIGVVCFFIYIMMKEKGLTDFSKIKPAPTSCEVDFLKPIFPGDKVTVRSKKIYFRLNKLKCHVEMTNQRGEAVCKGYLSGISLDQDSGIYL